jgi:hypothetical protein
MKKIRKYKNGPDVYILDQGNIEIGQPFKSSGTISVAVELNLDKFVDGYDYHDFPSSETLYFGEEDLIDAIETFQELLDSIRKMKNE